MKLNWWCLGFAMGAGFVSLLAYFDGWMPMGSCAVTHEAIHEDGNILSQVFHCNGKSYLYTYDKSTDKQYFKAQ